MNKAEKGVFKRTGIFPVLFLGAVSIIVLGIRVRLLNVPLERDEGEYAYAGWLMLKGIPPYVKAYNMKMPGIYAMYALIMGVFGENTRGIHLGLLAVNLLSLVLLYLLVRRLFCRNTACLAAAFFALLSVSPSVTGVWANSEHFLLPFVLAGLILMVRWTESQKRRLLLACGLLLGTAFVVKQHAVFFILFGAVYAAFKASGSLRERLGRVSLFLGAAAAPFLLTCLLFRQLGIFKDFWFWTVRYAGEYATLKGPCAGLRTLSHILPRVLSCVWGIWALAGMGAVFLFHSRYQRMRSFPILFLVFSFLAVTPGFYFRPHYFILMLPAVSMLAALGVDGFGFLFRNRPPVFRVGIPATISMLAAGAVFFSMFRFFFVMTPAEACRSIYTGNPFEESIPIAEYIRKNTTFSDRIAVIGSEPQIYFYAKRISATGFIYTYSLMEDQPFAKTMQEKMIREIESENPKYLVLVNVPTSWLVRRESDVSIETWIKHLISGSYEFDAMIEMFPPKTSQYTWGEQARYRRPRTPFWVAVFKRMSS
jgi:hypothetical protein